MDVANPVPIAGIQSVNPALGEFAVRKVRLSTGEHLPLLVSRSTGAPETYVLRYTLAALRSPGLSHNTIELRLGGIGLGLSFLRLRGIDLVERIAQGLFLQTEELTLLTERFLSRADGKGSVVGPYLPAYIKRLIDKKVEEAIQFSKAIADHLRTMRASHEEWRRGCGPPNVAQSGAYEVRSRFQRGERARKGFTHA